MGQNLSEITTKLNIGLVYVSIIYLPQRFLNFIDKADDEQLLKLVNKPFIIDKDGYDIKPTVTEVFNLLGKSSLLNQNIFYLNNLKQEHNKDNFNYILDKYVESMNGAIFLAEYFSKNIYTDIPEAESNIKSSFINQYHFLIKHKEEFDAKFRPHNFPPLNNNSWLNKNTLNNIKDTFPNSKIKDFDIDNLDKKLKPETVETKVVKKSKAELKKEKLKAIKEQANQEAENYILERVFNLKV